jgi:hypothetical protein
VSGTHNRVPPGAPCSCSTLDAAKAFFRGDPRQDIAVHKLQRALGVAERVGALAYPELKCTRQARRCVEIAALLHQRGVASRREVTSNLRGVCRDTVSHDFAAMAAYGLVVDPNWKGEKRDVAYVTLTLKGRARLYDALRELREDPDPLAAARAARTMQSRLHAQHGRLRQEPVLARLRKRCEGPRPRWQDETPEWVGCEAASASQRAAA